MTDPIVWRWPGDEKTKRRIIVDVVSWRGLSIGAKHWHCEVRVLGNERVVITDGVIHYVSSTQTMDDWGVVHKAQFLTPEMAAKWGRYVAAKLMKQIPGCEVVWKNPKYSELDTGDPFPAMYWSALMEGFQWWNESENEFFDPGMRESLTAQGCYDFPAWDHLERVTAFNYRPSRRGRSELNDYRD